MKFIPFVLSEEQDSWFKIINDIFSLEMGEYENLGFGDFAFNNLRSIIIGMVLGIILAAEVQPVAVLGNAHRKYIILFVIDIVQNGFGRAQGNLMLRADTAEQNANADFLHIHSLFS